jgi:hypothetical protein
LKHHDAIFEKSFLLIARRDFVENIFEPTLTGSSLIRPTSNQNEARGTARSEQLT